MLLILFCFVVLGIADIESSGRRFRDNHSLHRNFHRNIKYSDSSHRFHHSTHAQRQPLSHSAHTLRKARGMLNAFALFYFNSSLFNLISNLRQ